MNVGGPTSVENCIISLLRSYQFVQMMIISHIDRHTKVAKTNQI